jgi:hypothetical protein
MKADGKIFLENLAVSSTNRFEKRFSRVSLRLGLGEVLEACELSLLYEASFLATLCNIAFNGLGGCEGEIKPERENSRIMLEREFMTARDRFFNSSGWKALPESQRGSVQKIFLDVFVVSANMV